MPGLMKRSLLLCSILQQASHKCCDVLIATTTHLPVALFTSIVSLYYAIGNLEIPSIYGRDCHIFQDLHMQFCLTLAVQWLQDLMTMIMMHGDKTAGACQPQVTEDVDIMSE